ncbi:MAG: hypothetical protein GC159_21260 [Phycisphaera sp.]|nr:hypothetical protein [Phycisphaera sp.]
MRHPLQQTGYKDSAYERPNQKYQCGWAEDGRPCRAGPTRKGGCTAAAQASCTPRKEGDRWHCGRLEAFGGACEHGPMPDGACCHPEPEHQVCQPRLCHRARRGRLTLLSAGLVLAFLTMMLAGPWSLAFVSPGKLTAAHSAIEPAPGDANNCSACHSAADGSSANFLAAAFRDPPASHEGMAGDSTKCVACHFTAAGRDRAHLMAAHSMDPAQLKLLAESHPAAKLLSAAPATGDQALAAFTGAPDPAALACSTCHHEHRGRDFALTAMSDTSCQVCHSGRFASFNDGHPEFGLVPRHRSGIAFNHQTHYEANFGDTKFDCTRCHVADAKGFSMLVKPFEQACAGCHNQGRDDHHGDEIKKNSMIVFQLPEMEVAEGVYWPKDTAVGERIKPLVRLLLAGDEKARPAFKAFTEDLDAAGVPLDWLPKDPKLATQLAAAMKRLVLDLTDPSEAPTRIAERLAIALDTKPDDPRVVKLAEQLATMQFPLTAWQTTWLKQVAADADGKKVDLDEKPEEPKWDPADLPAGWYVDPADVSVNYGPTAHADPLLHNLLDLLAAHADPTSLPSDPKAEIPPSKNDAEFLARVRTIAFQDLASKDFGGALYASCVRCHTLDKVGAGYRINWTVVGRYPLTTGFGKFNHSPHMSILTEPDNCRHCHEIAGKDAAPASVQHGFVAHRSETCAACHAPDKAPNNCVTCHFYHMNRP